MTKIDREFYSKLDQQVENEDERFFDAKTYSMEELVQAKIEEDTKERV